MKPNMKWFKESERERIYRLMQEMDPKSGEYKKLLEVYEKLSEIEKGDKVSKDTLATIAANLLGIGLILEYEQLHVISTKALNFVIRGRL